MWRLLWIGFKIQIIAEKHKSNGVLFYSPNKIIIKMNIESQENNLIETEPNKKRWMLWWWTQWLRPRTRATAEKANPANMLVVGTTAELVAGPGAGAGLWLWTWPSWAETAAIVANRQKTAIWTNIFFIITIFFVKRVVFCFGLNFEWMRKYLLLFVE